jgi:hypothetical protein
MNKKEDEQNIHGIIILYKIYNEHNSFMGILTDESFYIKGYVKRDNYSPGQQVIGRFHTFSGYLKIFIDSVENSMGMLFWNNKEKLSNLIHVLNSIDTLPENIQFDGLYDKFLSTIAAISVDEINLKEWDKYIFNL